MAKNNKVKRVMEEFKSGKLRSGRNGKKVTSRSQAIELVFLNNVNIIRKNNV